MNIYSFCITAIFAFFSLTIQAQQNPDDIIFKALNDEMSRSLSELKLDKYKPPFYLANYFTDCKAYTGKATLGALIYSKENPIRQAPYRLMVGDYTVNDENFVGGSRNNSSGGANLAVPLENDYWAIRRAIWSSLDRTYKSSIDTYTQKLTAINQQIKEDSEKLNDYTQMPAVNFIVPAIAFNYSKAQCEKTLKEVSSIFKNYPTIQSSSVDVVYIQSTTYMLNSEGSKIRYNGGVACFIINASTQAIDGEVLSDHVLYFAPTSEQLPTTDKMKTDVKQMADALQARCSTMVIEEAYQGPVIFEGDALAELFSIKLFNWSGLLTSREPLYAVGSSRGSSNKIETKIGKRLCSENITITAEPTSTTFGSTPLVGTFNIDAEGIKAPTRLLLVDKGILKTLLSDRVPTPKVKESNGHNRFSLLGGYQKSPGVINIAYTNGQSYADLLTTVTAESVKSGLDYFYSVRKFETPNFGSQNFQTSNSGLTKPIAIYKVSVKTGEEKLIRCATISDFPMLSLKYALGGTSEQFAYNTLRGQFIPVSYIVPKAMAFNDISIEKDNAPKAKLPIVANPLTAK